MNYNTEDNEKALEVLTDLVEENTKLKQDLFLAHRFMLAQLLNSENGEIKFINPIDEEALDMLVPKVNLVFHIDSNGSTGGVPNGTYLYTTIPNTYDHNSRHFKVSKQELLDAYDNCVEKLDNI